MNELKEFIYGNNAKVRVVQKDGEPWFVVKDICDYFGVTNRNRVMQRISDDEKEGTLLHTPGGNQKTTIISEGGLYNLLFTLEPQKTSKGSKEDVQKRVDTLHKFKYWVTHEVLPTIRKTGGYVNNEDQFISTYLSNADDQTKTLFKITLQTVNNLNAKIEKDKQKVAFAEAVAYAEGNIKVGDAARIITQAGHKINQNDFYTYLRDHKYLQVTERSKNLPTHFSIVNDLIRIEEHVYTRNGKEHVRLQAVITPKGQRYFVARLVYDAPVNVEI